MPYCETPEGFEAGKLVAELAEATYRVARRNDFKGALIDFELDLWQIRRSAGTPRAVPAADAE